MVWWWPAFLGGPHTLPPALGPHVPGCGDLMTGKKLDDGIFVRIYYPTQLDKKQDHSHRWRSWIPHGMYINGFASVLGLWRFLIHLLFKFIAGDVKIPAVFEAPLLNKPNRLRTVVFSHGMGGTRFLYTGICCELAAHGYVVAAIEHRDESAAVTCYYPDGQNGKPKWLEFKHVNLGDEEHKTFRWKQVQQRAMEATKALDLLRDLDQGKIQENVLGSDFDFAMFRDRLDLTAPIMVGHSFGGATALLTLMNTPAFKTGIILDPWMFPLHNQNILPESISQPLLCINMQAFQIPPNLRALEKFTSGTQPGPRKNYTIRETTHENQSDSVHLIGYWLNFLMKKIDPVVATRINNGLIINFLREHAGLEGPSLAEVSLNEHNDYIVEDLTIHGIQNKTKKIPKRWLTVGAAGGKLKMFHSHPIS